MNKQRLTIRFNLDNDLDRKAWEYLQTQGSKNKAIIYALNSQNSDIAEIIKQTIKECLKDITFTQVKENTISNDENLIPNNWYKEGINFNSMKEFYFNNRTNADAFGWGATSHIFINGLSLREVQKVWIKSIIKHPVSFIRHILNFANNMFLLNNEFKISSENYFSFYSDRLNENNIPQYSRNISDMNKKTLNLLYMYLPNVNLYVFLFIDIFISIMVILSLIYNHNYINKISIFCLSVSLSSIAASTIVVLFTPIITLRYIYPIVPITILSIISFITFIFDIGGIKKIIRNKK